MYAEGRKLRSTRMDYGKVGKAKLEEEEQMEDGESRVWSQV
jgi:hypothetical protein